MPIASLDNIERSLGAVMSIDYEHITVTALANGNYAVTHTEHTAGANTNYLAVVRIFTAGGVELIPNSGFADGSNTTFAALPDGRIAFGFIDENSGELNLTFGTHMSMLSTPAMVLAGLGDPGTMVLAGSPDGRILVLALNNDTVIGQYVNPDGSLVPASPFTVYDPVASSTGATALQDLKVTALADGTFLIGWNETRGGNSTYATTILTDQIPAPAVPGISEDSITYRLDAMIALKEGSYASVTEYAVGSGHQIDLNIGADIHVVAVPLVNAIVDQAAVAQLADGRFVVTWHQLDATLPDPDGAIMARLFNADGTADGAAFLVNTNTNGDEREPKVAALPNGHFVIVWHTENAAGNSIDGISSRTYDPLEFKATSIAGETYAGGNLGDNIQGEAGADHFDGKGGNDVLAGFEGDDELTGGDGRDTLLGGDGDDTLVVNNGDDAANEIYNGGANTITGDILAVGKSGSYTVDLRDDTIAQIEYLHLGTGALTTGAGTLRINASQLAGLEVIDDAGAGFKTTLAINMGALHLFSVSAGQLHGFANPGDVISVEGTTGSDTILGSNYSEKLQGFAGVDSIVGGGGNDTLDGGANNDILLASSGKDSLLGGTGNDSLDAGSGDDTLVGGSGNDTLSGGAGKDTIDGGLGAHDIADYAYAKTKVTATLSGGKATVTLSTTDTDKLTGIEDLTGGTKGDALTGDTHANILTGNGGKDTLSGGKGNDTLNGGVGNDSLTGGVGGDHFRFDTALGSSNVDVITDFAIGTDKIELDDAIFAAIGGTLTGNEFRKGAGLTAAVDANDFIIYDTNTGKLYYDAGGNGGPAPIHFATLTTKPPGLLAGDFIIV